MGIKRIVIAGNRTEKETSLRNRYCQTVFQVGGLPVLVSVENAAEAQAYAEAFDALLLPGGNDLPGALFGQAQHPVAECDSPLHDQSDRCYGRRFMRPASACSAFAVGCRRLTSFAAVRSFNTCRMYLILCFGMPAISMAVMTYLCKRTACLHRCLAAGSAAATAAIIRRWTGWAKHCMR